MQTSKERLTKSIHEILSVICPNKDTKSIQSTPERFSKALLYLTKGYTENIKEIVQDGIFEVTHDSMIIVRDIEFSSLCEHHMLPFLGKVHIGYIPRGKILGLSKFARIVETFSKRLQIQERLTHEILETIETLLEPSGVIVVIEAEHLCMKIRGVEKHCPVTKTIDFTGAFSCNEKKMEFFHLL